MFHVKPEETDAVPLADEIRRALSAVGIRISAEQCRLLTLHASLVLRANERMNLTRITEPRAVAERHVADSLAFTGYVAPLEGRIIDIGAGAGYPGIPLAIFGCDVQLCESVKKKAAFLEQCITELGIRCDVHAIRAEELALQDPGRADVVVARAVSALASLVELAAPLLRDGGRLVALKGTPTPEEEAGGRIAAEICGLRKLSRSDYVLPGGESRSVLVFMRTGNPRLRLPRSPGTAQKRPLGSNPT